MLLSCSEIILLHNIENEMPVASVKNHYSKVNQSLFNSNSKVVVSGGDDGVINFYSQNLEYVSSIADSDVKGYSITSLAFSNSSQFLSYSSNNGILKIWEFSQEKAKFSFDLEKNFVSCLNYNMNESFLASGTIGGDLIVFNSSYTPTKLNISNFSSVNTLKCSPFLENLFISGMNNGELFFIDAQEKKLISKFSNHSNSCTGISFSPLNSLLFCSVGLDKNINFFDTTTKTHVREIGTQYPLTSVSFNIDGKTIAVSNVKGEILIYDLRNTSQPIKSLLGHKKSSVNYIEFSRKDKNYFKTLNKSNQGIKVTETDQNQSKSAQNKSLITDPNLYVDNSYSDLKSNRENRNTNRALTDLSNIHKTNKSIKHEEKIAENTSQKQQPININQSIQSEKPFNTSLNNNFSNNLNVQQNFLKNQIQSSDKRLNSLNTFGANDMPMSVENEKQLNNSINNKLNNFESQTNMFIKNTVEVEFFKLKQFIHEEIQGLHIEVIRQFEIQQNELVKMMKNLSLVNEKTAYELDKLQKENQNLRSQYF